MISVIDTVAGHHEWHPVCKKFCSAAAIADVVLEI